MKQEEIDFKTISETPGIYLFRGTRGKILYVGRATTLRSRIRSYFSDTLEESRGVRLTDALEKTKRIESIETDSVLEAYVLEAEYIKKFRPPYNVVDKDDKSFQWVGITEEEFPQIRIVRGREVEQGTAGTAFKHIFGPFPRGTMLKEALNVLRKILPYRDTCKPFTGKKCFRSQLGLCPGVCAGLMDKKEYAKRIREIRMFFEGKKKQLVTMLEKEMKQYAHKQEFEQAEEIKRRIFALTHIQDIALIKKENTTDERRSFRIEAYDVAHLRGKQTIGAMVVLIDGENAPSEYRTFNIREVTGGDDVGALRETLNRRLKHPEWRLPNLIVIDGGKAQLNAAEKILSENGIQIPVVSVVKTERHTPRELLGDPQHIHAREKEILKANNTAHRFVIGRHRKKRSKEMFT